MQEIVQAGLLKVAATKAAQAARFPERADLQFILPLGSPIGARAYSSRTEALEKLRAGLTTNCGCTLPLLDIVNAGKTLPHLSLQPPSPVLD